MAWITSPLLAIYNVAPISIFMSSGVLEYESIPFREIEHSIKILIPIGLITFNALILWYFNIWLARESTKRNLTSSMRYVLALLFTVILVFALTSLSAWLRPVPAQLENFRYYPFVGMVANTVFILIMIDLIQSQGKRAALELEKTGLVAANLKARHEQLKQQIHPHFLFNALNTLKLLIKSRQVEASTYTVRLSRFLRASLTQGLEDKMCIQQELSIFKDFMELQRVRFPDAITYEINLSPMTINRGFLPAFTFQALAENALKHNALDQNHPLHINIMEKGEEIHFVNNLIPFHRKSSSTGIGLVNLSERFRILSGQDISIDQHQQAFNVKLKVIHP
ncbi:MAG: histidine kinase [Cytophagales bacterium]|nr:histidine kinase [Cytophagales bacterium]